MLFDQIETESKKTTSTTAVQKDSISKLNTANRKNKKK